MKRLLITAALVSVFSTLQGQDIDLSKYDQLQVEQRAEFFGGMSKLRLKNESDFLKALVLGTQDTNELVRRRASQRAAMALQGLQQMAQSGRSVPVELADLNALEGAVKMLIKDTDRETRAAAVLALAAVRAPAQTTEALLLGSLEIEQDEELRASLIETMTAAGYQSASFKQAIVNRIPNAGGKELEALATSANRLQLTAALPALIEKIGKPDTPQVQLLRSIGGFGKEARAATSKIEAIIADPASTCQAEAQSALADIAKEPPPRQTLKPFVDLVASSTAQNTAHVADTALKPPPVGVSSAPKETPEVKTEPKLSEEPTSSTPWSIIVVLIVAAIGLLWLLVKNRK